jgi:hypothetical protein
MMLLHDGAAAGYGLCSRRSRFLVVVVVVFFSPNYQLMHLVRGQEEQGSAAGE